MKKLTLWVAPLITLQVFELLKPQLEIILKSL
jgi:hypothetical protein